MLGVLGKYRLDARLGGGGMAEVFLASTQGAEGFSRKVAIKRVLPGFSDNPVFAQMFIDEAKISSRLVHPNVVSTLDFDRDGENRLFLVMELVEGKDLDALVSSGPLPIPVIIFLMTEVLRGLGFAHDLPIGSDMRGVVHRDVSPHNVLLSWEGAVKVSDFGIAKARSASEATASVLIKGKPAYMSPEQANGQRLDGRSDLFAVGIMLWEMLVGRRLFVGEDTRATLAAVLFGQVPRPRGLRPDVPKDLERVVMKLLERDVPARYASAEAAIHDLLECADAPKAGRELLVRVLAERFPRDAHVRQSAVRAPRGIVTPAPAGQYAPTVPGHHTPAAAMPSLGAVMSAPTRAMERRPKSKPMLAAIVGLVTLASGVLTFAVVRSMRGSDDSSAQLASSPVEPGPAGSATTPAAPAAPPPPGPAPEPATVPPDAAAPPVDAPPVVAIAPVDAPSGPPDGKKDASSIRPSQPAENRKGKLDVSPEGLDFSVTVYLGKQRLGDSPFTKELPVGTHSLRLVNTEHKINVTKTIKITEGATFRVKALD
jgi:serine/threonine-protein kinase